MDVPDGIYETLSVVLHQLVGRRVDSVFDEDGALVLIFDDGQMLALQVGKAGFYYQPPAEA